MGGGGWGEIQARSIQHACRIKRGEVDEEDKEGINQTRTGKPPAWSTNKRSLQISTYVAHERFKTPRTLLLLHHHTCFYRHCTRPPLLCRKAHLSACPPPVSRELPTTCVVHEHLMRYSEYLFIYNYSLCLYWLQAVRSCQGDLNVWLLVFEPILCDSMGCRRLSKFGLPSARRQQWRK